MEKAPSELQIYLWKTMPLHYTKHSINTKEWLLEGTPNSNLVKPLLSFLYLQCWSDCHPTTAWAPPNHPHPLPISTQEVKKEWLTK